MADEEQKPTPVPYQPAAGQAGHEPAAGTVSGRPRGAGPVPPAGAVTTAPEPGAGTPSGGRRSRQGHDLAAEFLGALRSGWERGISLLAAAVMIVAVLLAVMFAVHILFAVFSANPGNSIVEFINLWSDRFAWQFSSLFTPHSEKLQALANYGTAAVAYLVAGRILAGVIRRLA